MKRSSQWLINEDAKASFKGPSGPVMAWARDIKTGEPVYIMELDESRAKSHCGCECPSCNLALIAVNAAKKCMVRLAFARLFFFDEEQFAQMYPASREWTAVAARP